MRKVLMLVVLGLAACGGDDPQGDGCWEAADDGSGGVSVDLRPWQSGQKVWPSGACLADPASKPIQYCLSEPVVTTEDTRAAVDYYSARCADGAVVMIVSPMTADEMPPSGGYAAVVDCGPCAFDERAYPPSNW